MKKVWVAILFIVLFGLLLSFYFFKNDITPLNPTVLSSTPIPGKSNLQLQIFAENLGSVRDLELSPGGTLLASITSTGEVIAFSGSNKKTIVSGLNKPHGLAFFNGYLFIAEETKVVRYNWDEKNLSIAVDKKLFDLPKGGRHFTRSIVFNRDGKMFVSLGSTCDTCFEKDDRLAAVIVSDYEGKTPRVFSKGLRNAVFIALNPQTNNLWVTEMGRDFLGDLTPSDEINILKDGADYGWPVCYENKIYDKNFKEKDASYCESTEAPVYKIEAHSAPLGLTFINSKQFPSDWQGDLLVAYHGSWNRSTPVGYKVVHMKLQGEKIINEEDFFPGIVGNRKDIRRPVDVVFDKEGNLFISDDKAGKIYKISRE